MHTASKSLRIVACFFLSVITLFLCFIMLRIVTRQLFVKHMGMSNDVIELILFDTNDLKAGENQFVADDKGANESSQPLIAIPWQEMYPFDESAKMVEIEEENRVSSLISVKQKILRIEDKAEDYTTIYLPWYKQMTEFAKWYEHTVQWNIANYAEYNSITQIDGQYFARLVEEKNVTESAESTIEFAEFCEEQGADFVFFQQPSKICIYEDAQVSGATDFSNQNADSFLNTLRAAGVDAYDHRADIHKEGLNHHSLFYHTDGHWKGETGLWASQHILAYLNSAYDYKFDVSLLDTDQYSFILYPDWFLGSQGKKVTLEVAQPEDISLVYPKYETLIHYVIPNLGIDEIGGFEITYDMAQIDEIDYYNKSPYSAYNHSDRPIIQIENLLTDDDTRMLILHNSFANCEIPFLAMGVKYVDAVDLRHFNGSIRSFIKVTDPDIVIVTYDDQGDPINWEYHTDKYDFR